MILHCIRHGESQFNATGRIQGQLDPELSELGLRQGAALARALAQAPIRAVYSSPLARARQTAAPIAGALGLPLRFVDELKELNAGCFQGKTWDEVRAEFPAESEKWSSHDPDYRIPGGESRRELMERGRAALHAIREDASSLLEPSPNGGGVAQVVVVSHGGLLSAALKALLEIPAERNPFSFYNASISRLEWSSAVRLMTLNQIDHLRRPDGGYDTRSGDL